MQVVYIQGTDALFIDFVQRKKAKLMTINDHLSWVITREDGSQYIARPYASQWRDNQYEYSNS